MMRGDRAYYGAQQIGAGVGEISRAAKSWATSETGATVLGVAGGIFAGEWVGSWLTEYINVEDGWNKVLVKAVAKGVLSFGLFCIARRTAPGGMIRLVLNGASAGSLASIVGDIVGEFVAPGMLAGLGRSQSSRGLTIKANPGKSINIPANSRGTNPVGGRGQVINI